MPTVTDPKRDQKYNPGDEEYRRNFDAPYQPLTPTDTPSPEELEEMVNGGGDDTGPDAALNRAKAANLSALERAKEAARNAEASAAANVGGRKGSAAQQEAKPANWDSNVTPNSGTPLRARGIASKYAKRWLIFGSIGTITAASGALVAGVMGAFVSMKELTLDFFSKNTYSSYSKRTARSLEKRLFTEPDENCKGVKCRLKQGVSDKEIEKYKKAGLQVDVGEKGGKKYIKSMTYTDEAGKTHSVTKDNFQQHYKNSANFRSMSSVVSKPKALVYRATHAVKKYSAFNIGRKDVPKSNKEHRKYIYGGGAKDVRLAKPGVQDAAEEVSQELTEELSEADETIAKAAAEQVDELEANDYEKPPSVRPNMSNLDLDLDKATNVGEGLIKGGIKGAVMGIFGLLDKACTGYSFIRLVIFGAKVWKVRALILYAVLFMTAADKLKAGDMPAAEIAFMAGLLMRPSTEQGPDLGKTAANSNLFSMVVGGGKVTSKLGVGRFTMGTAFLKFFQEAKEFFERAGANRETCKHVQAWYGQLLGIAGGILTGIFSGGTSTIIGIAGSAAIGAVISVMTEYVAPMLISYGAGTSAPDPEDPGGGKAAGDGAVAGIGAFGGELAKGSNRPVKRSEAAAVAMQTNEEMARINAAEQVGKSPFALDNPYSITNKLALAMAPYVVAPTTPNNLQNIASLLASPFTMVASSFNRLFTGSGVSALDTNYGGQFCADEEYAQMELLTDANCNPVYGEQDDVDNGAEYDPQLVLDYMVDEGHIDNDTASPKSDDYEKWLRSCTGEVPLTPDGGGTDVGDDVDTRDCSKTEKKFNMFRKYYQDTNIDEGTKKDVEGTLGT